MKIVYIYILCLFLSSAALAQRERLNNSNSQSVPGTIVMPSLLSIDVSEIPLSINLSVDDLTNSKIMPGVCNVNIKANIPWQLGVSSSSSNFESGTNSEVLPAGIISLKSQYGSTFYGLSKNIQFIAENENENIENNLSLDMKIGPVGSNYSGGNYSLVIFFTLTAQ